MTASALLDLCRSRGVLLSIVGGSLKLRGPTEALQELKLLVGERKAEILALLKPCPGCSKPMDRDRCWQCGYRACEGCGRDTGSVFIAMCLLCQYRSGPSSSRAG
jgi:hypothetical protein